MDESVESIPPLQIPPPSEKLKPKEIAEVKPKKPGILKKALEELSSKQSTPEQKKSYLPSQPLEYLIVFGQAVLNRATSDRPTNQQSETKYDAEVSSWARTAARAAAELKIAGAVRKIILSGGKTGGEPNPSEAELMRDIILEEYKGLIDPQDVIIEDQATNTLTNLGYSLKAIDRQNPNAIDSGSIAFLSADFQLARIRTLAHIIGIDKYQSFSSEQIFKLIAHLTDDTDLNTLIDQRLNLEDDLSYPGSRIDAWYRFITNNEKLPPTLTTRSRLARFNISSNHPDWKILVTEKTTYFERLMGNEARGIKQRLEFENFLTRGYVEVPEFFLGFITDLPERLQRKALNRLDENILQKLGIDPENDPIDKINLALAPYKNERRQLLESRFSPQDEWPDESRHKLEEIRKEISDTVK